MDVISCLSIVVHEFIFNVLRLALEVVPVAQQRSGALRPGASCCWWAQSTRAAARVRPSWQSSDRGSGQCDARTAQLRARCSTHSVRTAAPALCLRGGNFFSSSAGQGVWSFSGAECRQRATNWAGPGSPTTVSSVRRRGSGCRAGRFVVREDLQTMCCWEPAALTWWRYGKFAACH